MEFQIRPYRPRDLEQVIACRYQLRVLVAGPDFAMGRDRQGDLGTLTRLGEEMGFSLESVSAVPYRGAPISSSRIRTVVRDGEVEFAAQLLGRDYAIEGAVEIGAGRGEGLGFPTANITPAEEILLPANGVYAARVEVPGQISLVPAVVNVGVAPTFGGTNRHLEVHLLDYTGNLVGCRLSVQFCQRLREERRFKSIQSLTTQIEADIDLARQILGIAELGSATPDADKERRS